MTYPNHIKVKLMILLISILPLHILLAADEPTPKGIFDVLAYKEIVNIELEFDLETVVNDRRSDQEYPAQMRFKDADKEWQEWDIKINTRGKFRRAKCSEMPPLKINFKKKKLEAAGLAPFDDFKLVTHCVDDYNAAKELILKEYLAYKMYNQLTPASFRVQLLNITYKDSNTGTKKRQMGFLIEDTAQLRARINAEKSKEERVVEFERFHPEHTKRVALFEYMIGNVDWAITYSKNVKYVVQDEVLVLVPYDFDFSALVGASYATVKSNLGQIYLSDRIYLGFEQSSGELQQTFAQFLKKKEEMYRVISGCKLLKTESRTEMIAYLDTFFENSGKLNFPTIDSD